MAARVLWLGVGLDLAAARAPQPNASHLEIMAFYGMGPYNLEQMTKGFDGGGASKAPWVTHMIEGRFADAVEPLQKSYAIYADVVARCPTYSPPARCSRNTTSRLRTASSATVRLSIAPLSLSLVLRTLPRVSQTR